MAFGTTGDISGGRRGWTTCDPLRRLTAHVGRPTLRFMPAPHPQSWTEVRPQGLYIAPGGFYVDPLRAVDRAVVTHGHSDHARAGHEIGRASWREKVGQYVSISVVAQSVK